MFLTGSAVAALRTMFPNRPVAMRLVLWMVPAPEVGCWRVVVHLCTVGSRWVSLLLRTLRVWTCCNLVRLLLGRWYGYGADGLV